MTNTHISQRFGDKDILGLSTKASHGLGLTVFYTQEFSIEIPDKDADTIHSGEYTRALILHDGDIGKLFPCRPRVMTC